MCPAAVKPVAAPYNAGSEFHQIREGKFLRLPPLEPHAILSSLGVQPPTRATPVSGGSDTAIWRVESSDGIFALRVFRVEQGLAAEREVLAMRAAGDAGLPVTAVVASGVHDGRPVLLLSWMPGSPLREELASAPWRAWPLGVAFGGMQARLHQTPPPEDLCKERRAWIDLAAPDDALRKNLLAAGDDVALLHLDYHPMNVLIERGELSAVLDWMNVRVGDRRADLARTASILRFAPFSACLPVPDADATRSLLIAGWRHGYQALAGEVHGMAPFYAWAAAFMVRDLAPRVGRPDLPWLTPELLRRVCVWGNECSEQDE